MDVEEQRSFIRFLAKELKVHIRELMAYQLLVQLLKQAGVAGVDELLHQARYAPGLQERLETDFEEISKLLPPAEPDHEQVVKELLEKWKPKLTRLN